MSGIFATHAQAYFDAGINIIPLRIAQKIPIPTAWQAYADTPLSQDTLDHWKAETPDANIGVVLGPQSNLCMIDIDTEDLNLQRVLRMTIPPSMWERRGRKGAALAYRYSGFKTFRIKDASGKMIVECLSAGTQLVLPPSIHPDTRRPYEADTDLFNPGILGSLVTLPPDIEAVLRSALEAAGCPLSLSGHTRVTDYVSPGARDVAMISVAGIWARGVLRGELPFVVAVDQLRAWASTRVEKVAGDDLDIDKGVVRLAEFLIKDVTGPKKRPLPEGWDKGLSSGDRTMFGFDQFTDLNVAWTYDRLKAYLRAEWLIHDPDTPGRRAAVDFLLERLVFSALDPKDETALLRYCSSTSECGFTEVSLRKSLHNLRYQGIDGNNQAEIAKQFIADKETTSEFVAVAGKFWQWQGSHWAEMGRGDLLKEIALEYGHLPAAKRAGDHKGILDIVANITARPELKDTSESGVNFANGFLTPDLQLRPHDPMYGCTYTLAYRYLPNQTIPPMFESLLHQSWGLDEDYADKVLCLQEAIALTMFNETTRFEKVFLLQGAPKSGKSQLLTIVENLLPPEVVAGLGPDGWGDKFLPAELYGKLLNVAGELSERKKIDGRTFKMIVSGESMTGQRKNGQPFKFRVTCAHWFASNHVPRTDDTSEGFNRRWVMLTYNRPVPPGKLVLGLGKTIAIEEREAIVSWAVPALARSLAQSSVTEPMSSKDRMQEVAKLNNSLRVFLLDSGKVLMGSFAGSSPTPIPEEVIYNAYCIFALAAGDAKPVSSIGFRQQMRELGSELGFQIRSLKSGQGKVDYLYESITLVSKNVTLFPVSPGIGSQPTSMSHSI